MVLHDCAQGLGFWIYSPDSEAHGNLIFYNGWQGRGTDRGHGHGIYIQNRDGAKLLSDNIIFDQFGLGIQAYGSGAHLAQQPHHRRQRHLQQRLDRLGHEQGGQHPGGVGSPAEEHQGDQQLHLPHARRQRRLLAPGLAVERHQRRLMVATGNYLIGGESTVEIWNWNRLTFTGNTIYGKDMLEHDPQPERRPEHRQLHWDNNRYFGSGKFRFRARSTNLGGWKPATGVDANSSYTPARRPACGPSSGRTSTSRDAGTSPSTTGT